MTPGIQYPFLLVMLLPLLTATTHHTEAPTTTSSKIATSVHHSTSTRTTSSASGSTTTWVKHSTSTKDTNTTIGKGTPSSVPSHHSDIPITPTSHSSTTMASSTKHSVVSPTSPNHITSSQLSIRVSFFFLSFYILNFQFNSSLEDPSSSYYQALQNNISKLFLQIYKQEGYMGLSNIRFRPGSVVAESTLAFREGTINAYKVETQFHLHETEAAKYNLSISRVRVYDEPFSSFATPGSGVPGWGIALLVLVCVLVMLATIYLIALAVYQCRRKSCGQLDIFPTRDAYHPMSEYPTYHTHGRYVPPGSTKRSPYEEVSSGNGGSSLAFTNLAATSADL
ncbi:mucin-1 [Rhynchocyon petersi]